MSVPNTTTQKTFAGGLEFVELVQDAPRWQCTACGYAPSAPLGAVRCPACTSDQYGHRSAGLHALQVRVAGVDYPVMNPVTLGRLSWRYRLQAGQPDRHDEARACVEDNVSAMVTGNRDAWADVMRRPWAALICAGGASGAAAAEFTGERWKGLGLVRIGVDRGAERWGCDVAFSTQPAWRPARINWRNPTKRLLVAAPHVSHAAVVMADHVRWILTETNDPHTQALRESWAVEGGAIADEVQLIAGGSSLGAAMDWCVRNGAVVQMIYGAESSGLHGDGDSGVPELGAGLAGAVAGWCLASGVMTLAPSEVTGSAFDTGLGSAVTAISGAARTGLRLPQIAWSPTEADRGGGRRPRGGLPRRIDGFRGAKHGKH